MYFCEGSRKSALWRFFLVFVLEFYFFSAAIRLVRRDLRRFALFFFIKFTFAALSSFLYTSGRSFSASSFFPASAAFLYFFIVSLSTP